MVSSKTKSLVKLLSACAVVAAVVSSTLPAYHAVRAGLALDFDRAVLAAEDSLATQRRVQKHFLTYGIYIPIDDIIVRRSSTYDRAQLDFLTEICGNHAIYIWVPLRFRLPIVGEKVKEWCLSKS